MFLTEDEVLVG